MGDDESSVFASNENAHRVLEWQLYTYHHIQSLATGILGAVFSGLAIAITLLTAFRNSIPSIPWAEIESKSGYTIYADYALSTSFVQAEVALNWIMAGTGLVLAGFLLSEAVYYFGVIVLGDRLSHLANSEEVKIVPLPEDLIETLPVTDYVVHSRPDWIVSNANRAQQADDLLRHGLYRLPITLFLALYYGYIYLVGVQISLPAIFLNQFNTVSLSALIAFAIWKSGRDWKVTRPTTYLWGTQIIFAFIGLGIFIVGLQ